MDQKGHVFVRPVLAVRLLGLMAVLLVPLGHAAPLVAMTDAEGDVRVDYPPTGSPYSGPVSDGVDLVAASFGPLPDGAFLATLFVKDLSALEATSVGVNADTMLFLEWDEEGRREGRWTARADYQPGNTAQWSFWVEGPCRDGNDLDGCAGNDRDIHDDVPGTVDMAANTVTIVVPASVIGAPESAARWSTFLARTDAVWPSYPVYIGDAAQDLTGTIVIPFPEADNGTGTGPFEPVAVTPFSSSPDPAPSTNLTSSTAADKRAPGLAFVVIPIGLAALAGWRRRQSR